MVNEEQRKKPSIIDENPDKRILTAKNAEGSSKEEEDKPRPEKINKKVETFIEVKKRGRCPSG